MNESEWTAEQIDAMALAMVRRTAEYYGDPPPRNPDLYLTRELVKAVLPTVNDALADQKRDLWEKISLSRIEADNWKGLYEKLREQLAAAQATIKQYDDYIEELDRIQ